MILRTYGIGEDGKPITSYIRQALKSRPNGAASIVGKEQKQQEATEIACQVE